MSGYIERAQLRFRHVPSRLPEHSPHPWQRPNYGAKTQFVTVSNDAPAIDAVDKTRILEVLGMLLFFAQAIECTLLTAIGKLATEESQATNITMEKLTQLSKYCTAHPGATFRFTASNTTLSVKSAVKGRSRAAGYFFMTSTTLTPNGPYKPNRAVHVLCHIMREVGALFHIGKEACPLRIALEEIEHPQPATPVAADNNTAGGTATDTVKQMRSKAINMHFYGIRNRVRQGQFKIFCSKGQTKRADYFSKHHPASHHQDIHST